MSRVLHIITGLPVGGAEMALYRLATASWGGRYEHSVIALNSGGPMCERFRKQGINVIMMDFKRAPIKEFLRLVRLVRDMQPDIVQTWMYHADLLGGLAARLIGNRNVIWGVRTTLVTAGSCARLTTGVRQVCAWLSRWLPETIVCVAEASRAAHAHIGYDADRMVVIGNGFDMSLFQADAEQRNLLRTSCGFDEDAIVIGTVGRFNTDKDHHNFVRAAGMLAARYPKLRFLMVGPGLDSSNMELQRWLADTGCATNFVLLGEHSDIPRCLRAMDIFCLPSRNEGFPNALGEAMAMGLPCVSTNVGDVNMLVADTGLVVEKENSEALALALEHIVAMPQDARLQMGQRARARIQDEFSMERARKHFEVIYERLLLSKGKAGCVGSQVS